MQETNINETTLTEAVGQAVTKGRDWKGIALGVAGTVGVFVVVKLGAKGVKKLASSKNWVNVPFKKEEEVTKEEEKPATKKTTK